MITLMVFTNGRDDLLVRTLKSFAENVNGPVTKIIVNDDTGDPEHTRWLNDNLVFSHIEIQTVEVIQSGKTGFNGAIRNAWAHFNAWAVTPFIFHLEDDFTFNRYVDLWDMMGILDEDSSLAQIALMRQPWNQMERDAGSLYELHKGSFKQIVRTNSKWVEHNMWFTTNPSLYRRELIRAYEWPMVPRSEGMFTAKLKEDGYKFGYMGSILDDPWVTHIGHERTGFGY